jgi:hypothetical protein
MKTTLIETGKKAEIVCGNAAVRLATTKNGKYFQHVLRWTIGSRSFRRVFADRKKAIAEGERIARALGEHKAAILQNHGLLTVGETVDEAAWWFITMERSCQAQLLAEAAAALGIAVRGLTPDEMRRVRVAKAVVVSGVAPRSVAALAGIARGTLILEVNHRPVGNPEEFAAALVESADTGAALLRIADNGRSRQLNLRWR